MGIKRLTVKLTAALITAAIVLTPVVLAADTTGSDGGPGSELIIYPLNYCLETEAVEIDARIPVIKGITDTTAQEEFNRKIRDRIIHFTEGIKEEAEAFLRDLNKEERPFFKYQAVVNFHVKNRGEILSLVFEFYQYTGGAHGLTAVESFNLDAESGEEINLELFLSGTDLNLSMLREKIKARIEEDPRSYFPGALEYIDGQDEFNYFLEDNQLVIYFQQYDIGPYAAGSPEFRIPLKKNY